MSSQTRLEPTDPPRRTLALPGGPASYCDEGPTDGPAIVAIHGLPGSARDFRYLAPHVSRHARVIRLELPGFGETPVATEPDPSPEGRARFVLAAVAALDLQRPALLGHSMGGVVACAVATQPGAASRLALLASPGLRPHAMLRRMPFGPLDSLLSLPLLGRALAPLLRRLFHLGGFRGYADAELYRTIRCVAHTSIARHADNARRLALPTLVAWCDDDPIVEAQISAELADALPAGPRLRFGSGGHNPQKSQAAAIAAALVGWLGETP